MRTYRETGESEVWRGYLLREDGVGVEHIRRIRKLYKNEVSQQGRAVVRCARRLSDEKENGKTSAKGF